jgi:hypothetical protein
MGSVRPVVVMTPTSGAKEAVQEQSHSQDEEEQESSEEAGTHHRRNQEKQPHRFTLRQFRILSQTLGL